MSDVFISYARSTAAQANAAAAALRFAGYSVWLDEDLPAHRPYGREIEAQLVQAKAALVIWSAEAVLSEWVLSEANRAREDRKLVQVNVDGARLPMPFDQIQCADLADWTGDAGHGGWRKALASIAELARAEPSLRALAASASAPPPATLTLPDKPSIAVMPFANLSGDPEQEYFADGMVEEIVTALSRFKSIFVIGSGSTLSFKGKAVSPQEAGRQLGVRYVLEGSVRKAGNRVRIAVKLANALDGGQIWADRFDDTLEDVFALQDKVALGVAGLIEPTVQQAEIQRASARSTENMSSYDLCLRALPLLRTYEKTAVLEALGFANRAIALDPTYGLALGLASVCHTVIVLFGWTGDDAASHRRQAVEMAHRALKVAGDDAVVLTLTALAIANFERDLETAVALVDRATALNPGSSYAWYISGVVRTQTGETDLAIEQLEMSERLDPLGPDRAVRTSWMAIARFQQRHFVEAAALVKQYAQQSRPNGWALLAASYGHLGQASAAREALSRYRRSSRVSPEDAMRPFLNDPAGLKLFLDGIDLAEGKSSPDAPVSTT